MYKRSKELIKIPIDNPVKEMRERLMISKAELARKAGISVLTVDRVEKGKSCRPLTKRKMVEALGFNPWQNRKAASPIGSTMSNVFQGQESSLKADQESETTFGRSHHPIILNQEREADYVSTLDSRDVFPRSGH